MSISDNIRRLRIVNNLKQHELADAIFVSRTAIANYENGRRIPDVETLKAIAKVLKVSISDLTDEQMDINLIRNEISNTNVLDKSKQRSLSARIMNIILTIALVISMALVLIPVIRNKHINNNINNFKTEDVEQLNLILTDGYSYSSIPFNTKEEIENNLITFYIINFDINKTTLSNKTNHHYPTRFYIKGTLKNNRDFIAKEYEDICILSNNNILYYDSNIDYFVLDTQVPIDIQLYYENKIWYIDIQESTIL